MRKIAILSLVLVILFALNGCGSVEPSEAESTSAETSKTETTQSAKNINTSNMFTDNDMEIGYDEETSTKIILSGDTATGTSNAVKFSDGTVTLTDEGTYIFSGTLNDGMIVVNAEDTDKVRLVLDGANIKSSDSAAIYVAKADKVFITTASDSKNTLINGGKYTAIDDNNIDAVVFSKSDLTLNGSGNLTIDAAVGHGVVSKDDLVLTGGTYDITAASHGLCGKDSVRIANGTYTITSGKDGIQAENTDDIEQGFVYIADGNFAITADGDGISASANLQIKDGNFTVNTGEGSAAVTMTSDAMGFGQRGGFQTETMAEGTENSVSRKGIKAGGTLTVEDGSFVMDTEDDSSHADSDILVNGGTFRLQSGDDAVHSDTNVTINNGDFDISYCYEGIEGQTITVDDGTIDITSVDDGLNSAGGTDSSGFDGGHPEQSQFSASSDSLITINGGVLVIVSDGDCIDSNGALTINGGKLNLTCNGNGNTALDCDGTYTDNGGDITTNDGSENNPGQMGGPGGMRNRR